MQENSTFEIKNFCSVESTIISTPNVMTYYTKPIITELWYFNVVTMFTLGCQTVHFEYIK